MKILLATHYFASHRGGIEIVAGALFRELAAAGHEVTWVASDATPPPEDIGSSRTVSLRSFNLVERKLGLPLPIPSIGALSQLRAEIANADVVMLHDCLYLSNIFAFLSARARNIPVVVIQHTVPNETGVMNLVMRLATKLVTIPMLSRAAQTVFISETTSAYYQGVANIPHHQTIFNGVDAELYHPAEDPGEARRVRTELGLPLDRPVILFVGRFVEKKGLNILREMAMQQPQWTFALAGWGPIDPQSWSLANVRTLSGLHGETLARVYRASDLLVLPSTREGFPLVIQEAFASGLAVVCGADTVNADSSLASHAKGVPIQSGRDRETATAFIEVIEDSLETATSASAVAARREIALSRYSWKIAAKRYLEIAARLEHQRERQLRKTPKATSFKRVLLAIASLALSVLLLQLLVRVGRIDLHGIVRQVRSVSATDFLILILLNVMLVWLSGAKWRLVDDALREPSAPPISRNAAFGLSAVGMALGLILPVQLGMAAARTVGTWSQGHAWRRGTGGSLFEQSFDLLVVAILTIASLVTRWYRGGATVWISVSIGLLLLATIAVDPAVRLLRKLAFRLSLRISSRRIREALHEYAHLQYGGVASGLLERRLLLLSSIRFAVVVMMATQTARAIGAPIEFWQIAAATPFVTMSTVIALTPGGIGTSELTAAAALHLFGTPVSAAAEWTLANRILATAACFLVAGVGILCLTLEKFRGASKLEAPSESKS